jgi:hypothetical protein
MKKLLLFIAFIICCRDAISQQIVERKNKITGNVTERYQTVITGDKQIRQGIYRAFYSKKLILATGKYLDDKKTGIWHYFDRNGKLMQNYDYDNNRLLYEAPEDNRSPFSYAVDDTITETDKVTQPVRLGGRYFGYAPYIKLFKLPGNLSQLNVATYSVTFELLVSPMGRLADLIVHVRYGPYEEDEMTYNANIDLLPADDKLFLPATFNKKPIASRINLVCYTDSYGVIGMY